MQSVVLPADRLSTGLIIRCGTSIFCFLLDRAALRANSAHATFVGPLSQIGRSREGHVEHSPCHHLDRYVWHTPLTVPGCSGCLTQRLPACASPSKWAANATRHAVARGARSASLHGGPAEHGRGLPRAHPHPRGARLPGRQNRQRRRRYSLFLSLSLSPPLTTSTNCAFARSDVAWAGPDRGLSHSQP